MTVHDHDLDLIMAIALGGLRGEESSGAAAEIAGCERCTADLAAQRTALGALAALIDDPGARLTELEARRLHQVLNDRLGHTVTAAPPPVKRAAAAAAGRGRRFNWAPLATVAAIFLAVVVGGNAIRSLTAGSDDSAGGDTAADAPTSADADGTDERRVSASTSTVAAERQIVAEATATTAAAAEGGAFADRPSREEVSVGALTELRERIETMAIPSIATDATSEDSELAVTAEETMGPDAFGPAPIEEPCIGAASVFLAAPAESVVLGTIDVADLGTTVVTVNVMVDGAVRILLHDPVSCTVVAEVP